MGIAISRNNKRGSRKTLFRTLSTLAGFIGVSFGVLLLNTQSVSAATTYAWINDRTINATTVAGRITTEVNFIDSNPNDTNRTFRDTSGTTNYCNNGVTNTISLGSSPAGGILYYVSTPEPIVGDVGDVVTPDEIPKVNCEIKSQTIAIGAHSSALIDSTNCEGRPGTAELNCERDKADGNAAFARTCGGPYPSGNLCVATAAPPGFENEDPAADEEDNDREPHPCDSLGDFSLRWVTCPILTAGISFADTADALIEGQLNYGVEIFDTNTDAGKNFKSAWNAFRTIGLSLMLIVGLIMVVSQAAGLQVFDAYAFRKTLPRLLIAVIGIALSWELLEFVIIFFNDLGHWVQDLVLTPFKNSAEPTSSNPFAQGAGIALVLSGALLGTLATAITLGPLGIISLVVTVFMAIMVGLFVLLTRSAVITLTIITAPLAIACWVLPGTKKVWDFWQNALATALFIFPIIMLLIAAGKAMAFVTGNGIMKVLFLVLPYILLPLAFRLAGGLMATIFSLTNDKTRGAFDRVSNFRRNQVKNRVDDAVNGTGKTWLSKNTGVAGVVGRPLGSVYRRGRMASEHGIRGLGGATYTAGLQKLREARAQEALKEDMGRGAGDDDANAIAQREGMTSGEFVRQYMQRTNADEGRARLALRTLETGYGAKVGSDAMAVAAYKARAMSGTGYGADENGDYGSYHEVTEDAARMVARGLISTQDAASAIKANQKRADLNGIGFGTWMGQIDRSAERVRANPNATGAALITDDEARDMRTEASNSSQPHMMMGGRHEAIRALAPQMVENLNDTIAHVDANGNPVGTDEVALGRQLARIASAYDQSGSNPLQGEILANTVLDQTLVRAAADPRFQTTDANGNQRAMNVREMIDYYGRTDDSFLAMRREYNTQAAQAAAQQGGIQQQQQQQSDRRLKRDIHAIDTTPNGITLYRFKYLWSDQVYIGVMAQDILNTHPEAVTLNPNGFYSVNYGILGVRFCTIEEWERTGVTIDK
jgi:hypothetical protein